MQLRVWYSGDSSTLEMASPLDMLCNWVGCGAALRCCVAAVELVADTFCKLPDIVGERFSPNFFFVSPYEVAVLLGLASDRESDGVCFRNCDIICLNGVL